MPSIKEIVVSALIESAENVAPDQAVSKLKTGGNLRLEELELESLDRMQVIMYIEEALDVELDIDVISEQETLEELCTFVMDKTGRD